MQPWRLIASLIALPALASAGSLVGSVNGALKGHGDAPVVTVACCGAGRSALPVVSEAVGGEAGAVSVVNDRLALLDVAAADSPDGTAAVAACDVLSLEVHFADLVERTAHGMGQLLPLLQRSVRVRDLHPQPKLLLLTVTGYDKSAASEADVAAFAAAQLDEVVSSLALPAAQFSGPVSAADLVRLQVCFVPAAADAGYDAALAKLSAAVSAVEGRPASSVIECVGDAAGRAPAGAAAASPAEVHAAYQCGLLAEAAARDFQKGLADLKKRAEKGAVADFGELASDLLETATARFDADSASFKGAGPPVAAARSALREQLQRALYGPYRKQLAALQRLTLSRFRAKVGAAKPAADIEDQMKALVKEASKAFDEAAEALLPAGVDWTYSYEKAFALESMHETAKLHVQTLQVQGLYLSKDGHRIPVDFSIHKLMSSPFGSDSRFDPVKATDEPTYKRDLGLMQVVDEGGYKPKSKLTDPTALDPKRMVFTDKMMQ